jgi:hypothetical protein
VRIDFERRQRRVRLHRRVRHFIRDEPRLRYLIGFGKAFVGIAKNVVIILLQIARLGIVYQIRLRLHRLFRIEVRRQHFVLDVDEFQRLLGDGL